MYDSNSDLIDAVRRNDIEKARKAFIDGADPHVEECTTKTRGMIFDCQLVSLECSPEMLLLFLENGLDVDNTFTMDDRDYNETVFTRFLNDADEPSATNINPKKLKNIKLLIDHGADVFVSNNQYHPKIQKLLNNEKMKRISTFLAIKNKNNIGKNVVNNELLLDKIFSFLGKKKEFGKKSKEKKSKIKKSKKKRKFKEF